MKIALIGNTDFSIYNYRFELCLELLSKKNEVFIICPEGNFVNRMVSCGCKHLCIKVNAHGMNPFQDFALVRKLKKILKKEKPDYVCGFTIKPNIYGAYVCKKMGIPFIANITGLGSNVEKKGCFQRLVVFMYRIAFSKIQRVFCQNASIRSFFEEHNIAKDKLKLISGSGVNLQKFSATPYPRTGKIAFGFVSRVKKEKGIDLFIDAARYFRNQISNVEFHVYGVCDNDYMWIKDEPAIIYHGVSNDTAKVFQKLNCLVFPSYYAEGLANVLLEASASGRPVITTDRAGCREAVENRISGYLIPEKDLTSLIQAIESFLALTIDEQEQMGICGRIKVEKEFDRTQIINYYLDEMGIC